MGRHVKPKNLSQADIDRLLLASRGLIDAINKTDVRTTSETYQVLEDLRSAVFDAARKFTGDKKPWPISSTIGPC